MTRRRGWSNEFPTGVEPRRRFDVDWAPLGLWRRVQAKAKRQGVSVRVVILRFLTRWVDEPDPS
jgi:hypothetical protein